MALKSAILTALGQNLIPTKDKDFEFSSEGQEKLEVLSEQLAMAIRDYIDELVFRVHDLKADTIIAPGTIQTSAGPNLNPLKVSVKVSQNNPKGITDQTNSIQSVVKVDSNVNRDKSGIA